MKNAAVNRNINRANSTKKYNFWSPLTQIVKECVKEDVNPTLPSKTVNGKGSIKFILPKPLPRYANINNKQRTHANKERTKTIIKETDFNMSHADCMCMSHSRCDDGITGIFDTGATSGVATYQAKKALIPTGIIQRKCATFPWDIQHQLQTRRRWITR